MNSIRQRATEKLPSVLLTLLSIIQAIALELLWDRSINNPLLFDPSWVAMLGWLQAFVTLSVIVLIWLIYVALVMRFRWTPAFSDSALPFVVGLAEFWVIELTGPATLGSWCIALGILAALAMVIDFRFVRRARRDPSNSEFFDSVLPATLRDFVPQISFVAFALCAGTYMHFSGHNGWFAVVTLLVAVVALGHSAYLQAFYWNKSMQSDGTSDPDN